MPNDMVETPVIGQQDDTVDISLAELIDEGTAETAEVAADEQPEAEARDGGAEPKIKDQTDFNAVLGRRLNDERARSRKKYESSDEYQLGKMLLKERAERDGVTVQEARKRIEDEHAETLANKYESDRKSFYRDYARDKLRASSPKPDADEGEEPDTESLAQSIARQVFDAQESGLLPEGFDPSGPDADETFLRNVQRFGPEAAGQIWSAQHAKVDEARAVADEIEKRRTMPRPMRPVGAPVTPPTPDFSKMSAEQFRKLEKSIDTALLNGKKPRLV